MAVRKQSSEPERWIIFFLVLIWTQVLEAHHVLGRPSYSLSEGSNTPPSMQVETQIGKYFVTYMVFPAFPKPNEQGRVNLYIKRIKDGRTFQGQVSFTVMDDSWFSSNKELLGVQRPDDNVFRQGFLFRKAGHYLIRAEFSADNEPYIIDFPLRIGSPFPVGPVGVSVGVIFIVLVVVNVALRKRIRVLKTRRHRDEVVSSSAES